MVQHGHATAALGTQPEVGICGHDLHVVTARQTADQARQELLFHGVVVQPVIGLPTRIVGGECARQRR